MRWPISEPPYLRGVWLAFGVQSRWGTMEAQSDIERDRFDAVIVGSGFGGSVMAYRLAHAGRKVLLLERGKAYPPGSFARTPEQMRTNWWDPSQDLYGLYDLWSFKGIE